MTMHMYYQQIQTRVSQRQYNIISFRKGLTAKTKYDSVNIANVTSTVILPPMAQTNNPSVI